MTEDEVLIMAKTRMKNRACIGGMLRNRTSVRLLDMKAENQPKTTPFEVGNVYKITFKRKPNCEHPHTEDILVSSHAFLRESEIPISALLTTRLKNMVVKGSPVALFDNCLKWTGSKNNSGYITRQHCVPCYSICFWKPDQDLLGYESYGARYSYKLGNMEYTFPYVGYAHPESVIPKASFIRLSLARWWKPNGATYETRCSLQLSGWFN